MSIHLYIYNAVSGDWIFDFEDEVISCAASTTILDAQELVNACRAAEEAAIGITYAPICEASGKNYLDEQTGVRVGITVEFLGDWQIYSQKTSGKFIVTGGNVLQGGPNLGGDPFRPNPLVNYISIQSAASTIVSVSTGSGLSAEEHNRLMALPTETLEADERAALLALQAGQISLADFKRLMFNRTNTVQGQRISRYVAGGDTAVDVQYDADGIPISETVDDN